MKPHRDFKHYDPLYTNYGDVFQGEMSIYPFELFESGFRAQHLLSKRTMNEINIGAYFIDYLLKDLDSAMQRLNRKLLEYKPGIDAARFTDCTNSKLLKAMVGEVDISDVNGITDFTWIEILAVNCHKHIGQAFTHHNEEITSKVNAMLSEMNIQRMESDEYLVLSKRYELLSDYGLDAVESINLAEGMLAALNAEKYAISKNTKKAGRATKQKYIEFREKYLTLYQEKYSQYNNSHAAVLIAEELKMHPIVAQLTESPHGIESTDQMKVWIGLWKRWKAKTGGKLGFFLDLSRAEVKKTLCASM